MQSNTVNTHALTLTFVEYMLMTPVLLTGILVSIIWDVFFIKRIRHFFESFRRNAEKARSDPFGNFSAAASQCKLDLVKYAFLLLINVTEFAGILFYTLGSALANEPKSSDYVYMPERVTISNCTSELTHPGLYDVHLITANPIYSILLAIGQVGLMFSLALVSCLTKFLNATYHNNNGKPFECIKSFLLITTLTGVFLIITGSVQQLMIPHKLIEPIVQLVYFYIWVRYARIFYKTLKWRTVELKVRGSSRHVVRRSIISCYQFALIMSCMGIAIACLILSEFLEEYFLLIATGIYYGPCLLNYLYATPSFQPLLATQQQLNALFLSSEIKDYLTTFFVLIASTLAGSQYLLATAVFFGRDLQNKLNYRFGRVRVRFTPDLTRHLLPK